MTTEEVDALTKQLTDQGMDEGEAKKFLARNCQIVTKGIQLPPHQAFRILEQMTKFGVLAGPVRFFIAVSKDNEQRLMELITSLAGPPILEGTFKPSEVGGDPIGDFARKINDGYAGSAPFNGKQGQAH